MKKTTIVMGRKASRPRPRRVSIASGFFEEAMRKGRENIKVTARRKNSARHSRRSIRKKFFPMAADRKSTRLNSSHSQISYAVFCLKKLKIKTERRWRSAKRVSNPRLDGPEPLGPVSFFF